MESDGDRLGKSPKFASLVHLNGQFSLAQSKRTTGKPEKKEMGQRLDDNKR